MSVNINHARGLGLAAMLSLVIIAPATAQEPAEATVKKERKICETIMTGTRLRNQRVCMTREQWRIANDRNREDLRAGRDQQHVVSYGLNGRSGCSSSSSTAC